MIVRIRLFFSLNQKYLTVATVGWLIRPNEQFHIGRRHIQSNFEVVEPSISMHHLNFRCVVYEDDDEQQVSPMVYVRVLSSNAVLVCSHGKAECKHVASKTDPDRLLDDGDVMHLTPSISLTFQTESEFEAIGDGLKHMQRKELEHFDDEFRVTGRRLGVGGNASVFVAMKQRTHRQLACKIVQVPDHNSDLFQETRDNMRLTNEQKHEYIELRIQKRRKEMAREYDVLESLSHPNIITLEKVFCATHNIYIFQELITGGDLLSYIDQKGALNEAQGAVIVRQILKAVEYLHGQWHCAP